MTEEPKHSTVTWETYRATLVNKTLHAFYLLGWIGLPLFVWRSILVGWQPANTVTCLLVVIGMVFYRLGDKASTNLRGMVLVGTFFGLAIPGLLNIGVLSNGLLLIATGCICASLVFSRRASLWLGGGSILFLSLVGLGYVTGVLHLQTDANAFAISPATWITAVFVNFLSVLILVMRISGFRESLKSALIEVEQQRDVIAHQANHDQLTNLPTLRLANDRLEMALKYMPDLAAIHFEDADDPSECQFAMAMSFCTQLFDSILDVPSYHQWFMNEADYEPAFRFQKQQFQVMQSQNPGRWTLKNPWHPLFLNELTEVYPDAQLVMTHRDPVEVVGSACSLLKAVRPIYSDHVDLQAIGQ